MHLAGREPNYFAADQWGRFNPPPGDATFGTCYCSESEVGAFAEVFCRRGMRLIVERELAARGISTLRAAADVELADFTDSGIVGLFGLTGTVSTGGLTSVPTCQRWAAALSHAGLRGIRYRARHDPSLSQVSYAIFGEPGIDDKP